MASYLIANTAPAIINATGRVVKDHYNFYSMNKNHDQIVAHTAEKGAQVLGYFGEPGRKVGSSVGQLLGHIKADATVLSDEVVFVNNKGGEFLGQGVKTLANVYSSASKTEAVKKVLLGAAQVGAGVFVPEAMPLVNLVSEMQMGIEAAKMFAEGTKKVYTFVSSDDEILEVNIPQLVQKIQSLSPQELDSLFALMTNESAKSNFVETTEELMTKMAWLMVPILIGGISKATGNHVKWKIINHTFSKTVDGAGALLKIAASKLGDNWFGHAISKIAVPIGRGLGFVAAGPIAMSDTTWAAAQKARELVTQGTDVVLNYCWEKFKTAQQGENDELSPTMRATKMILCAGIILSGAVVAVYNPLGTATTLGMGIAEEAPNLIQYFRGNGNIQATDEIKQIFKQLKSLKNDEATIEAITHQITMQLNQNYEEIIQSFDMINPNIEEISQDEKELEMFQSLSVSSDDLTQDIEQFSMINLQENGLKTSKQQLFEDLE